MLPGNERQAAASYAGRRRLGYRYAYRPRRRRRGRAWAAGGGMRRLARQPRRTAWLHDDYDADQLLQHAGWVDREERSGRVLPLHADARCAELPRPQQQRSDPKGKPAATWRQQHPVPDSSERLPAPAPEQRSVVSGTDSEVDECVVELRPMRALARGAELAGPASRVRSRRARDPWFPARHAWRKPEFAAGRKRDERVSAPPGGHRLRRRRIPIAECPGGVRRGMSQHSYVLERETGIDAAGGAVRKPAPSRADLEVREVRVQREGGG
jgi:hypothetical protein